MKLDSYHLPELPNTRYPYGVRIEAVLDPYIDLREAEDASNRFSETMVLRIAKLSPSAREQAARRQPICLELDAFESAGEAETGGKHLTVALLWLAVSTKTAVGIRQRTGRFPFAVRDRTRGEGMTCSAEGFVSKPFTMTELSGIIESVYRLQKDDIDRLSASMELFASARLEESTRARFISLVTSIEALAKQEDYGDTVAALLERLATDLSRELSGNTDLVPLADSLSNRMRGLRRESVRRAIRRLIQSHLSEQDAWKTIEAAYEKRSKILHEGAYYVELDQESNMLEVLIKRLYSAILGIADSANV